MSVTSPPAIAGGTPIRVQPLPYGRHHLDDADIAAVVAALRSGTLTGGAAIADFEHALAARGNVDTRSQSQTAVLRSTSQSSRSGSDRETR